MGEAERESFVAAVRDDWRSAALSEPDLALADYADKLTRTPGRMREADVIALREAGFDDVAIHDAIQVIAYFNYINRVADGVDVELEPEYPPDPRRGQDGRASMGERP